MRKRYGAFETYPNPVAGVHRHPLDMGDGTFVLISGLEKLQGITPSAIRAQEAQEGAAQPGPVSQSPGGDGLHSILAETYPQWRARMPSEIPDGTEGVHAGEPTAMTCAPLVDPERASECLRVGRIYVNCLFCGHIGDATSDEAGRALLKEHVASVAHDRAYEARLRENVENARTALYDYLKSRGRVA